jgi:hypothetical protein
VSHQPVHADLVVLGLLGHPGHRLRPDGPARGPHDHRVEPGGDGPAGRCRPPPTGRRWPNGWRTPACWSSRGPTVPYDRPPKLIERRPQGGGGPRPARDGGRGLRPGRRPGLVHPGVTGVNTSAAEAWEQGAGVCQDIAHLTAPCCGPRPAHPLRLRLPAPRAGRGTAPPRRRAEPRLDRVLGGRLVRLRPHQPHPRQRVPRRGRPRPRLRRRDPAQGDLPGGGRRARRR